MSGTSGKQGKKPTQAREQDASPESGKRIVQTESGPSEPGEHPTALEGLSGMGGFGGKTEEEKYGENFTDELESDEKAAARDPLDPAPDQNLGKDREVDRNLGRSGS